jgi:serine protease Do
VTTEKQKYVPGENRDRILLPLAFCRECGQEYYAVRFVTKDQAATRQLEPRELNDLFTEDFRRAVDSEGPPPATCPLTSSTAPFLNRVLHLQFAHWLPEDILTKQDKMSMAHGLEVRVPFLDIEVFKVAGTVHVGDPNQVKVGQWVAAIGSPFGFENSISAGIVSAKGRALPDETYVPFIQTDTAVNPGNSGGPLFDLSGNLIGINSQIYSRTGGYMGLAFAIPIDIAMDVASQLQDQGRVTRGRIGVQIQELSADLAKSFGLSEPNGALVSSVEKDGPADKAGFKTGDVIVEFDGKKVTDSRQLPLIVGAVKPGRDAIAKVWRDGKEQTLHVTVGELQPEKVALAAAEQSDTGKLGLAVQDLTPEQRRQLEVKGGVLVGGVDGPAARAGLRQGDVVIAVNGEQIDSAKQFKRLVEKAPADKPVALLIQRGDVRLYVPVTVG